MPRKASADVVALNFRLPKKLHKHLERAAKQNTTSINAEMVNRLEDSLKYENWQEDRELWLLAVRTLIEALPEAMTKLFEPKMDELEIASERDLQKFGKRLLKEE